MSNYKDYKFMLVPELPKRGKKKTMYWVERDDKYEAYIYDKRSWTCVDERKKK